jgi:hypothetical protein
MDQDILEAFDKYKKAKKRVECEKMYLLSILPDDVASEFHYNGRHAIERYPEYAKIIEELLDK